MLDIRLLKSYSAAEDVAFIRDTIYTRIKNVHSAPDDEDNISASYKVHELLLALQVENWASILQIAQAAADLVFGGNMTYMQTTALAKFLGCHQKVVEFGCEPQPEFKFA
jgi:hypothetical protein